MNERLRQRLLQVFCAEHADHLSVIRQFLEQAVQGDFTPEQLNEAFRRAHSLKGAARAVDLQVLEQGAHQLESLFAKIQAQELSLPPLIKLFHQWLDLSEDWLAAQLQHSPAPDPTAVLNALAVALSQEPVMVPAPASVTAGLDDELEETSLQNRQMAENVSDTEFLRISGQRLESLLDSADRLSTETQQQKWLGHRLQDLTLKVAEIEKYWGLCQAEMAPSPERASLGYALRELAELTQENRFQQQQSNWKLTQEVLSLQNTMRNIRMQPSRSLFQAFPKMLRRLAREQGKEIECQFTGLDIEADRSVLQALKDPVMHLLRNALAHGIELPEERRRKGKDPTGRIFCHLEVRRHQLVIRIGDDGQGLNQDRIRTLLAEKSPEKLQSDDWQNVIFEAGFSTASGVNELRGRGMGLSVVAENIARLQGQYRMVEQPQGLCFELEVPLQIVTYRLLLFSCYAQTMALPVSAVRQLLRLEQTDLSSIEGQTTVLWQDNPIPFYSLSQLLFNEPVLPSPGEHFSVIVLDAGQTPIALHVDLLLADQENLLRPLTGPASQLPLYLGAALAPQGQPIPVLNPAFLGQLSQRLSTADQTVWSRSEYVQMARILVVDDSITTRTLERTILETQGYRVDVAVHGREALKKLRESAFDLVITDVQMPEMDGLELLALIKQDPHLSALPVIVLTSLNAYEDQKKGLELGAAAYLVKQKFEQQELLEMIEQLL